MEKPKSKIDLIIQSETIDQEFNNVRSIIFLLVIAGVIVLPFSLILGKSISFALSVSIYLVLFLYIYNGFSFSPENRTKNEMQFRNIFFWWQLIIYPLDNPSNKQIILPEMNNSQWNLNAAIIPELWFLYNEIWGPFFIITACYMLTVYLCMSEILPGI